MLSNASCRGGCGDVYVDEWVSEPPCIDNCGYGNGCDTCGSKRPVRSLLRALWGTPYRGDCGCDSGGCSSCGGGMAASQGYEGDGGCNCGGSHGPMNEFISPMSETYSPSPSTMPSKPSASPKSAEDVPTPAPVAPSSARRLSPAQQRASVTRASTR